MHIILKRPLFDAFRKNHTCINVYVRYKYVCILIMHRHLFVGKILETNFQITKPTGLLCCWWCAFNLPLIITSQTMMYRDTVLPFIGAAYEGWVFEVRFVSVAKKVVVLYSIVWCSHVQLKIYNELCGNIHSHVRIECGSLLMDVPT